MLDERPFHFPVADRFASLVEVQQAVQPDRYARENPVAQPQLGPDRAAGPQPDVYKRQDPCSLTVPTKSFVTSYPRYA